MDLKTPLRSLGATFKFNAKRLSRLEIESVQDLLFYTPFRYENSSIVSKIGVLQAGETVTIKGRVVNTTNIYTKKHLSIQKLTVEDETGKIPPRLVDINTEFSQLVLSDLHVLNKNDYEKASRYLLNPHAFDFYKLMDWDFKPSAVLRPIED